MAKTPKNMGDYEAGYGKPPKKTQWKKGQSGNPSGKQKNPQSIKDKIKKIASEEIIVHKNGSPVAMTNLEAMLRKVFMEAQNGHPQFCKLIIQELGLDPSDIPEAAQLVLTEADLAVLKTHADWVKLIEQATSDVENAAASDSMNDGDDHDDPNTDF
jgi:hypothetical protein